jgi:hypothetical protein
MSPRIPDANGYMRNVQAGVGDVEIDISEIIPAFYSYNSHINGDVKILTCCMRT